MVGLLIGSPLLTESLEDAAGRSDSEGIKKKMKAQSTLGLESKVTAYRLLLPAIILLNAWAESDSLLGSLHKHHLLRGLLRGGGGIPTASSVFRTAWFGRISSVLPTLFIAPL